VALALPIGTVVPPAVAIASVNPRALIALLREMGPLVWVSLLLGLFVIGYAFLRSRVRLTRPFPRPLRFPHALGLFVVGLLAGAAIGFVLNRDEAPDRFPALEAALKPPAGSGNAYPLLEQATLLCKQAGREDPLDFWSRLAKMGYRPDPEWLKQGQKMVDANRDVLALADGILARGRTAAPLPQTSDEASLGYPGVDVAARQMALLMAIQSRLAIADGRPGSALKHGQDIIRLGLMLGKGGSESVQVLSGMSLVGMGLAEVQAAAWTQGVAAGSLRPAISDLRITSDVRSVAVRVLATNFHNTSIIVDRAVAGDFGYHQSGRPEEGLGALRTLIRRLPMMRPNMSLNPLGRYLEAYALEMEGHGPEVLPPVPFQSGGSPDACRWTNVLPDILVGMWVPSAAMVADESTRLQACADLTRLSLALRCYQLEHGKLPGGLDDLAPAYISAVPLDPFTGKAFRFELTGAKPRVWSVGPDQVTVPAGAEHGDDVVVPLVPPEDKPSGPG
jgi:hypothetical protein